MNCYRTERYDVLHFSVKLWYLANLNVWRSFFFKLQHTFFFKFHRKKYLNKQYYLFQKLYNVLKRTICLLVTLLNLRVTDILLFISVISGVAKLTVVVNFLFFFSLSNVVSLSIRYIHTFSVICSFKIIINKKLWQNTVSFKLQAYNSFMNINPNDSCYLLLKEPALLRGRNVMNLILGRRLCWYVNRITCLACASCTWDFHASSLSFLSVPFVINLIGGLSLEHHILSYLCDVHLCPAQEMNTCSSCWRTWISLRTWNSDIVRFE